MTYIASGAFQVLLSTCIGSADSFGFDSVESGSGFGGSGTGGALIGSSDPEISNQL